MINDTTWQKPDPPPNAMRAAFTHAHETLLWASKGKRARHAFNYDLVNFPNPNVQVSSVLRTPTVPKHENLHGYHSREKPLKLMCRALPTPTREGELAFDSFCGSGTIVVAPRS